MAETGKVSGADGQGSGKTVRVSCMSESGQWQLHKDGKRLRNETPEQGSTMQDWRSRVERTVRQQALEVTQLNQTINRIARMLEAHAAREEAQWLGMKE